MLSRGKQIRRTGQRKTLGRAQENHKRLVIRLV
jgi:hypothetical protein